MGTLAQILHIERLICKKKKVNRRKTIYAKTANAAVLSLYLIGFTLNWYLVSAMCYQHKC